MSNRTSAGFTNKYRGVQFDTKCGVGRALALTCISFLSLSDVLLTGVLQNAVNLAMYSDAEEKISLEIVGCFFSKMGPLNLYGTCSAILNTPESGLQNTHTAAKQTTGLESRLLYEVSSICSNTVQICVHLSSADNTQHQGIYTCK